MSKPRKDPHEECKRVINALTVINKDLGIRIRSLEKMIEGGADGNAGAVHGAGDSDSEGEDPTPETPGNPEEEVQAGEETDPRTGDPWGLADQDLDKWERD